MLLKKKRSKCEGAEFAEKKHKGEE